MPFFFLENLGGVGLIEDIPPEDLVESAWTAARNVEFTGVQVQNAAGLGRFLDFSPWLDKLYGLYCDPRSDKTVWYGIGEFEGEGSVVMYDSLSDAPFFTRLEIEGYEANEGRVTGGAFGSAVIFMSGRANLIYAISGGSILSDVLPTISELSYTTDIPLSSKLWFNTVRPWKSHLWGLGVTVVDEDGVDYVPYGYYPKMLWCSDAADPGYIPGSWEAANPETLSRNFITPFSDCDGDLIDLVPLGPYAAVYQENAIHLITYTGDFPNLVSINTAFPTIGAIASNCVIELKDKHIVFSQDDVIAHNGSEVKSILNTKVKKWLFKQLSSTRYNYSFLAHNQTNTEILICYWPEAKNKILQALVWNYTSDTFSVRDFPEDIFCSSRGKIVATVGSFADYRRQDVLVATSGSVYRMGLRGGAKIYTETGGEMVITNQTCQVERTGLALKSDGAIPYGRNLVTEIWPEVDSIQYKGQGAEFSMGVGGGDELSLGDGNALKLYFGSSEQPGGTAKIWIGSTLKQKSSVQWQGPFNFSIGKEDFIPVLSEGVRHAIRMEWENGEEFSLSRIGLNYEPLGRF